MIKIKVLKILITNLYFQIEEKVWLKPFLLLLFQKKKEGRIIMKDYKEMASASLSFQMNSQNNTPFDQVLNACCSQ